MRRAVCAVLVAVTSVAVGCGVPAVRPGGSQTPVPMAAEGTRNPARPFTTNEFGLRVFAPDRRLVCSAFDFGDRAVSGTLRITPEGDDVAWIEDQKGRHLSVIWPTGFSLSADGNPTLFSDDGWIIGTDGSSVSLQSTALDEATGSFADPYFAHGDTLHGCYP